MSPDLLETAKFLAKNNKHKPREVYLRRAVSTAYYAVFHAFAKLSADTLAGQGRDRPNQAWRQAYRALDHKVVKEGCDGIRKNSRMKFPEGIKSCADAFIQLQEMRHQSDYDPEFSISRGDTLSLIAQAEAAIESLRRARKTDKRAFVIQILFKRRK